MSVEQKTVTREDDGIRLDRWFRNHYPALTFGRLSKLLRTGQIRVDGKRAKAADRINAGAVIRVPPLGEAPATPAARARPEFRPEDQAALRDMVLYEDEDVLILDKPPGLAVQGGSKTHHHLDGMLASWTDGGPQPRLVHRLDKDTSGVIVLAKTGVAAAHLGQSFYSRAAKKIYWALVVGTPREEEGLIKAPLAKEPGARGERMEVADEGKDAMTRYHVMEVAAKRAAWLALMPLTGRTHQLRAHCAHMGCPIVGDGKYGGQDAYLSGTVSRKLHLHARRLMIPHPRGGTIDVTAPLPAHMAESWAVFGFDADDRRDPFRDPQKRRER